MGRLVWNNYTPAVLSLSQSFYFIYIAKTKTTTLDAASCNNFLRIAGTDVAEELPSSVTTTEIAGVHGTVAEDSLGGQKDLCRLGEVCPQSAEIGSIGDLDTGSGELLCDLDPDALIRIVNEDYTEVLLLLASLEKSALNEVMVGVCEHDIVVGNHVGRSFDDHIIRESDALTNVVVNGLVQELLGVRVGKIDIDLADLELEPSDGIAHGEAHGAACCEILDLGVKNVGGKMA
ncbi:hypothetical protein HG530_008961 [Fusarium avenaceum]|nr:hypothetical protein HG530_008961 [Fusarium avenaceum]